MDKIVIIGIIIVVLLIMYYYKPTEAFTSFKSRMAAMKRKVQKKVRKTKRKVWNKSKYSKSRKSKSKKSKPSVSWCEAAQKKTSLNKAQLKKWKADDCKNLVAENEPHIGILVKSSTPTVQKINKILAHTKQYGCDVVTELRKHTDAIIMKAMERGAPSDIPCEVVRTWLSRFAQQVYSSRNLRSAVRGFNDLDIGQMLGLFKYLDYSEEKSEAAANDLLEVVQRAPETASTISQVAMELLELFEAEYCNDGKITIEQLEELSDDMFDILCN